MAWLSFVAMCLAAGLGLLLCANCRCALCYPARALRCCRLFCRHICCCRSCCHCTMAQTPSRDGEKRKTCVDNVRVKAKIIVGLCFVLFRTPLSMYVFRDFRSNDTMMLCDLFHERQVISRRWHVP